MAECPKPNGEKERKVKRKKCEKLMKAPLHHPLPKGLSSIKP